MSCAATRKVKVVHNNKFGENKCGRDSGDCKIGVIRGGVQNLVSHQTAEYVSERTVRYHTCLYRKVHSNASQEQKLQVHEGHVL